MIFRNDVSTRERELRISNKKKVRIEFLLERRKGETFPQIFQNRVIRESRNSPLLFLSFFLLPPLYPRATRDAPVELVRKLIAPPPRFNSIIQAASCRCKFHPPPPLSPSSPRPRNVHLTSSLSLPLSPSWNRSHLTRPERIRHGPSSVPAATTTFRIIL